MGKFTYKSYAWNVCGTSFRRKDTVSAIHELLCIINDFWNIGGNATRDWSCSETQALFYDYAYSRGFLSGDINKSESNKAKDARQITSGIDALGFLDEQKRLTQAGRALCDIDYNLALNFNDEYQLPEDVYLFFCQMLKLSKTISGNNVRPYLVLGKLLKSCDGYLTKDEFTYLLPLCIKEEITRQIIEFIQHYRQGNITIDEIITSVVLENHSFPEALEWFLSEDRTDETICEIVMHYNGPIYARDYVPLYEELKRVYLWNDTTNLIALRNAINDVGPKSLWSNYCFANTRKRVLTEDDLNNNEFDEIETEEAFDRLFFKLVHLFKTKYMLEDYYDNNKRFFRATNTLIFDHDNIRFTPLFSVFFSTQAQNCFNEAYVSCALLDNVTSISDINPNLEMDNATIITIFNNEYNQQVSDISEIYEYFDIERTNRFRALVDSEFTNDVLIHWFEKFKDGSVGRDGNDNDNSEIKRIFGESTDEIPAILEYMVGVMWYRISGYSGRILEYIRTGMTADLYPTHHAPGTGVGADIIYEYEASDNYIQHDLLIEMTTERTTSQRELEMESVTRHLAKYMVEHRQESYCIFIGTKLRAPLISDFRLRRLGPYYYDDDNGVDSMKIITLDCEDLINILRNGLSYEQVYQIADNAYTDTSHVNPLVWYAQCIKNAFADGI